MTTSETSPSAEHLRLSIFGLGYVGCVSAACLAARGHTVLGVDANPQKTEFIRDGRTPIVEEKIGELIADVVAAGRLLVSEPTEAVHNSDITIVCVGTPSGAGGSLSTQYLESASQEIGQALATKDDWHVVVYRSTMIPGTVESVLIPILERTSGKKVGVDFGVCLNPEFLRESTSVKDFLDPPKTVVGESDERSGALVMDLYEGLPGPRFRVPIAVAEMAKYVDNSFHAVKVTFGNEIGAIYQAVGLDSHKVIEIFLADTKLNISPAYLRPGFAFGGSCLPKDLRAMASMAEEHGLEVPLIAAIGSSNRRHLDRAIDLILSLGGERVGILGMAFKSGTDDLRESPVVELIEALLARGRRVSVHDPLVSAERLLGANRQYADKRLPGLAMLLENDLDHLREDSDLLVVAQNSAEYRGIALEMIGKVPVIDLTGALVGTSLSGNYHGLAW